MKLFARVILSVFSLSILLLSFQNCASYSENSLFESNSNEVVDLSRPSVGSPVLPPGSFIDLRGPVNELTSRVLVLKGTCYTAGLFDASFELKLTNMQTMAARNLCGSGVSCDTIRGIRCNQGQYLIQVPLVREMVPSAASYRGSIQMSYRSGPNGGVIVDPRYSSFFSVNIQD